MVCEDGSKTIVKSELLDASKLPDNYAGLAENLPDHAVIGMEDPWHDPDDWGDRRRHGGLGYDNLCRFMPPTETHFFMRLRMEPLDPRKAYTIQYVEAPQTRVVMHVMTNGSLDVKDWTEEKAQQYAENFPSRIIFFLDIP